MTPAITDYRFAAPVAADQRRIGRGTCPTLAAPNTRSGSTRQSPGRRGQRWALDHGRQVLPGSARSDVAAYLEARHADRSVAGHHPPAHAQPSAQGGHREPAPAIPRPTVW